MKGKKDMSKKNKKQRKVNAFDSIFDETKETKKKDKVKVEEPKTIKGQIILEDTPLGLMKELLKASSPMAKMVLDTIERDVPPEERDEYTIEDIDVDSVGEHASDEEIKLPDEGLVTIQFKKGDGTIVSYSEEDLVNEKVEGNLKSKLLKVGIGCLVAAGVVLGFRTTDLKL